MPSPIRRIAAQAGLVLCLLCVTGGVPQAAESTAVAQGLRHFLASLDLDLDAAESRQREAQAGDRSIDRVVSSLSRTREDYGRRRAEEVKTWLEGIGVTCGELKTLSYGDERPAAVASEPACWQLNRSAKAHVQSLGAQ